MQEDTFEGIQRSEDSVDRQRDESASRGAYRRDRDGNQLHRPTIESVEKVRS